MSTALDNISVMKFGGSSFATAAQIAPVCRWITEQLQQRGPQHRVICVVSAPSGLTEQYRDTLLALNPTPSPRLIDAALPLADSLGAVLVAAALQAQGVQATVTLGNQIGLRTDDNYTRCRLRSVDLLPMLRQLEHHQVVTVPGGQASADSSGETTWMGKNSSDFSAIALAASFGCKALEICSDVPGVYSSDPNLVPGAVLLPQLSHAQAIEMSVSGAKVLHHRGVEHALHSDLRIVCRRNHGAFEVGTVLESGGHFEPVVVPDARAQTFAGTAPTVKQAAQLLETASVPFRLMPGTDAANLTLVVTCGFFDAWHFLGAEHRLPLRRHPAQLLTLMHPDGTVQRELVMPDELAKRARQLHARFYGAAADQASQHGEPAAHRLNGPPLAEGVRAFRVREESGHV